jgi:glycosyltransferase involved in cell wall biosynthesis
MVGRLVKEKGCDYFLRAAKEVLRKFPDTKFALVGEGPERPGLEKLAHELRIENSVLFYGHRTDMPSIYAGFDICVLPSFVEGMPMTVLEAMAAAKPVIATGVGQIPELVESETSGLLVDPGNIDQLSGALAKLLADPTIGWKMGEQGRQRARKFFSADTMARGYLALYHQLVGNQARQGRGSNEGIYYNLVG